MIKDFYNFFKEYTEILSKVFELADINTNSNTLKDKKENLEKCKEYLSVAFVISAYGINDFINTFICNHEKEMAFSINYYSKYGGGTRFGISHVDEKINTFTFKTNLQAILKKIDGDSEQKEKSGIRNIIKIIINDFLNKEHDYVKLLDIFYQLNEYYRVKKLPKHLFSIMDYFQEKGKIEPIILFTEDLLENRLINVEKFKKIYDIGDEYDYEAYFNYLEIAISKVNNTEKSTIKEFWDRQNEKLNKWLTCKTRYNQFCISANDNFTGESRGNVVIFTDQVFKYNELEQIKFACDYFISNLSELEFRFITENKEAELYIANLRSAIISILVDSYAHNISAHSLAALELWFRTRSEFLERKIFLRANQPPRLKGLFPNEITLDELKSIAEQFSERYYEIIGFDDSSNTRDYISLLDIVKHCSPKLQNEFLSFNGEVQEKKDSISYMPRFPIPLDSEIWKFLKFLRDKAAFWSGVTRDIPFGGEAKSLYEILWNHLTSNALYLGTIAYSEKIMKMIIYVEFENKFKGEFAIIDLSLMEYENMLLNRNFEQEKKVQFELESLRNPQERSIYNLVIPGKDHSELRKILEDTRIFFPGGIVGVHSFLTLVENSLRNIKHYKNSSEFSEIQKNGIKLKFDFSSVWLMNQNKGSQGKKHELLKCAIYLDHYNYLYENGSSAIDKIQGKYSLDVLDENQKPRLGGSTQDKICAAMLFNNSFISVNNKNTDRDKRYNNNERNWIKVSSVDHSADGKTGKLVKDFYLWKRDFVFYVKNERDFENENVSRFKIVYIEDIESADGKKLYLKARENGVIRIISKNDLESSSIEYDLKDIIQSIKNGRIEENNLDEHEKKSLYAIIYNAWLEKFLVNQTMRFIYPSEKFTTIENLRLVYHGFGDREFGDKRFLEILEIQKKLDSNNYEDNKQRNEDIEKIRNNIKNLIEDNTYIFRHGGSWDSKLTIDFRSHGKFVEYHYNGSNTFSEKCSFKPELIETFLSKVIVVDDRLAEREDKEKSEYINKKILNLEIYYEKYLRTILENTIQCNFLVVHLTAIESLNYGEEKMESFIEKVLAKLDSSYRDKFLLIITTGRGRSGWYDAVKKDEYKKILLFRPIESFLSAIEDAVKLKDDFEVKHNIIKVIFGS